MSRFLNATRRVELGECRCPGTPHESDWADVRLAAPWGPIVDATNAESTSEQFLIVAAGTIVRWNLCDDDGPAEIDTDTLRVLDVDTFLRLSEAINAAVDVGAALPNPSSATSRRSRQGSAESQDQKAAPKP